MDQTQFVNYYLPQRKPKGQLSMNNPKKLAKLGTQEENKQNKAQIHNIRYVYLVIQNVCALFTRPSYDILVKQQSTLNKNIIANTIF